MLIRSAAARGVPIDHDDPHPDSILTPAPGDSEPAVASGGDRGTVCIAASPGGHIAELLAVRGAFDGFRRVWVTGASKQADALAGSGEEVDVLPSWGRDPPGMSGLVPNLRAARRLVEKHQPHAVVTNGAGLIVPFALMARLRGSELVVIETMARVTRWSLTGRILAPFARALLVQWPEMRRGHRRAVVCRPALLEAPRPAAARPGEGTFVSVGTRPEPFDRLLAMVDRAVAGGTLPPPVVAQSGSSRFRPAAYSPRPWMAPEEVHAALTSARYVVCHGGTGMIASAIGAGRRPLVLARRKAAGEHRTEHQQQIVDRLAADGVIVALRDEIGEAEIRRADAPPADASAGRDGSSLEETLRSELHAARRRGP